MNKYIFSFFIAIAIIAFSGCSEDEEPDTTISVISVEKSVPNDFDKYLNKIFVEPYNIDFLYKFEDIESDLNYQLVPAVYENSIKMANLVKYLCLDAFDEVSPDGFLKVYFPKMLMMVGSAGFRNNGTRVLGTAEGGLKITLYEINNLDVNDVDNLYDLYFRTIYHEFGHILHQTKDFTTDFDKISATDYVGGAWDDAWDGSSSLEAGFISDYSSKEVNEDFVELFAHYITYSKDQWDATLLSAGDEGGAKITQKMSILKSYLKQVWDIDIDDLRDEIYERGMKLGEQDLDKITLE